MDPETHSLQPDPAEGSRETVDRELNRQDATTSKDSARENGKESQKTKEGDETSS